MFKMIFKVLFSSILVINMVGCKSPTLNQVFKDTDIELQTKSSDARQNMNILASRILARPASFGTFAHYIKRHYTLEVSIPSKDEIRADRNHEMLIDRDSDYTKIVHIHYKQVIRSDREQIAGVVFEVIGNPLTLKKMKQGKSYVVDVRINDIVIYHINKNEYFYLVECFLLAY